jgi:hypothetical protein
MRVSEEIKKLNKRAEIIFDTLVSVSLSFIDNQYWEMELATFKVEDGFNTCDLVHLHKDLFITSKSLFDCFSSLNSKLDRLELDKKNGINLTVNAIKQPYNVLINGKKYILA